MNWLPIHVRQTPLCFKSNSAAQIGESKAAGVFTQTNCQAVITTYLMLSDLQRSGPEEPSVGP